MPPTYMRMIGVFGQREMECAAIKILDNYWNRPYDTIDESIFTDDLEQEGFRELKNYKWMDGTSMSEAFWKRIHGR